MSPHQKAAHEIIHEYYFMLPNNGLLNSGINNCDSRYKEAIECALIGVKRLILTLEFIPNINMMTSINNVMRSNINNYLSGAGIIHNDLIENVFEHKYPSNEIPNFLIMDFEDVDFINNSSNRMNNNNSNNNNYKITKRRGSFNNNNMKKGPGLFGDNNN